MKNQKAQAIRNIDLQYLLDKRYSDYKSGKVKLISAEESKKEIQQLLAKATSCK